MSDPNKVPQEFGPHVALGAIHESINIANDESRERRARAAAALAACRQIVDYRLRLTVSPELVGGSQQRVRDIEAVYIKLEEALDMLGTVLAALRANERSAA